MLPALSPRLRLPLRVWLLLIVITAVALGAIGAHHPADYIVEHVLTAAAIIGLIMLERCEGGTPLSRGAYVLVFAFGMLHVLGSHYTYSRVPYDDWSRAIFGGDVSSLIGAASFDESGQPRNHFDRLVHFSFGLLLTLPCAQLLGRWLRLNDVLDGCRCAVLAVIVLCAAGALYEIAEWLYAEVAGEEMAAHYNGQQGDAFDAHKDMALNLAGSVIAAGVMTLARRIRVG